MGDTEEVQRGDEMSKCEQESWVGAGRNMCAIQTLPVIFFSPSAEREPTNEYFLIPDGLARISSDRQADSLWGKEKGRPHVHMRLIVLQRQRQIWVSWRERY